MTRCWGTIGRRAVRAWILALLVCAAVTGFAATRSAAASPSAHGSARRGPRTAQRVDYYLALGDSVPVWTGRSSYPYQILAHYRRKLRGLRLHNIAVSGETTTSMLHGQYPDALAFLKAHRHHVTLITIDIGGNDIIGCALQITGAGPTSPCAIQALATIKRSLKEMLAGLHVAAPGVPIVGMTYYNPLLGDWLAPGAPRSLALTTTSSLVVLNRELTSLYGGSKNTADVQSAFASTNLKTIVSSQWGRIPIAVAHACSWLDISCHPGAPEGLGDDPNVAGEGVIATTFERTIDRLCASRRSSCTPGL